MEEINEFEDPVDRHLSFIDFANDAIWALKRLIPMYAVVIIGALIWSLYNPQVKITLLNLWALCNPDVQDALNTMQNNIFGMFR
jgi:hypothetical protein